MKTRRGFLAHGMHLRGDAASVALPPPRPGRCTFFVLAAASLVVTLGAAPACSTPRTPDTAAAGTTEADGGELTCDERARAQVLCQSAMRQRCESQVNDCDSRCDVNGDLPANSQKAPTQRSYMESTQCRANCRQIREGCVKSAAQRCPAPCP
jgi:hypothetical protein